MKDFGKSFAKDLGDDIRIEVAQALHGLGDELNEDEEAAADRVVERQIEVGARPELTISNVSGRITVTAGEDGIIRIRASRRGSSRAMSNTDIEIEQNGNHVSVRTKPRHLGLVSANLSSVEYDVTVPADCEVRAKGVSADIVVRGTQAPVSAETVSGDVTVSAGAGTYGITTVSGDICGDHLRGELALRTTSGDARITHSWLRTFNLNTVSGDVSIETPLTAGEHYLAKTVSGDLHVLVPEGSGATVQMKSVSGSVASELPAEIIKAGRRTWQGRINGGGANVEMQSVSGDLRIARGANTPEGSPPASTDALSRPTAAAAEEEDRVAAEDTPATETPASTDSEMLSILKQLEAGEITLEEATARLEALE